MYIHTYIHKKGIAIVLSNIENLQPLLPLSLLIPQYLIEIPKSQLV